MDENPQPRSRRAFLLTGGAAALAAGAVVAGPSNAEAANGQALKLGTVNHASAPTSVTTTGASAGLAATNTNTATSAHGLVGYAKGGYGLVGSSTAYHGGKIYTANPARNGLVVENTSTTKNVGVALTAKHFSKLAGNDAPTVLRAMQAGTEALQAQLRQQYGPSCGEFVGKRTGIFGAGVVGAIAIGTENGTGLYGRGGHGVHGVSEGGGIGVYAQGMGAGAYGLYASGGAHYLSGNTQVVGNLAVSGTLSKSGGSFRIDHPLDPAHKYLSHSFVESPDMKNVYDGVVVADASGAATVELPEWFEALNSDFRYQLTPIGGSAPELHVGRELADGSFAIAGAKPGQKVSWQLTGIRKDVWAEQNRIPVEHDKASADRGRYLYPEGFGKPASARISY